jgi:hypothetical protein
VAEETFFSEAGISVTRTLLTTPGKSVSIDNVASVSKRVKVPSKTLPIVIILVGVAMSTLFGVAAVDATRRWAPAITIDVPVLASFFGVGLIPLAIGIVMLIVNKKTFEVRLESSGASSTAFSSKDEALVDRIVSAVTQSIAARG